MAIASSDATARVAGVDVPTDHLIGVERLAVVECADMAMLLRSLRARVIRRGARNFRAYAELVHAQEERDWRSAGTWNRVQRMPAGPAGVITPWNAPFMLS